MSSTDDDRKPELPAAKVTSGISEAVLADDAETLWLQKTYKPHEPNLTLRGIVLGALITVLFTAANVYLGLRAGLTFATSIPAAVISMAVLRLFRRHSVLENNIVQTTASAGSSIAAGVVFTVPALYLLGFW